MPTNKMESVENTERARRRECFLLFFCVSYRKETDKPLNF